jgi:hypothetical protein
MVRVGEPASEVLATLANAAAPGRLSVSTSGRVSMLKDETASICAAKLRQRLKKPHTGSHVLRMLFEVTADAAGETVPGGFVGSCVAKRESVTPFTVDEGVTLEEALNTIALQAEGTVWVAVQSANGECSLGVKRTADEGVRVCVMSISQRLGR